MLFLTQHPISSNESAQYIFLCLNIFHYLVAYLSSYHDNKSKTFLDPCQGFLHIPTPAVKFLQEFEISQTISKYVI